MNRAAALHVERPTHAPGVLLCLMVAAAAMALAALSGLPVILIALGLGIAARPIADSIAQPTGISWSARAPLRLGIALIGVRLSLGDLSEYGWPAVALAVGAVAVSLTAGTVLGRALGLGAQRATLSAGAVGICGASAALAISAVLPASPQRERQTVYTICAVTLLSTIAMVAYPLVARIAGLDETAAGLFLGASIHDLAQVIGAGAMVSPGATEAATVTKLIRVACLAPVVLLLGLCFAQRAASAEAPARPPLLPGFLVGFVALAVAVNLGLVPRAAIDLMTWASALCLIVATAALGLKTIPGALAADGWRPALAAIGQTLLLGAAILGAVILIA